MPRPRSQHPTELELEILKALWRLGPSPVRAVRDALAAAPVPRDLAYTSVMTVMAIMAKKRYVSRRTVDGGYVYSARIARESTAGRMLRDVVDRAFSGSAGAAVLNLLNAADVTPDELRQLRELIDAKEREQSASSPSLPPPARQKRADPHTPQEPKP